MGQPPMSIMWPVASVISEDERTETASEAGTGTFSYCIRRNGIYFTSFTHITPPFEKTNSDVLDSAVCVATFADSMSVSDIICIYD